MVALGQRPLFIHGVESLFNKLQYTKLSQEKWTQDVLESPEVTTPDVADVFIYWAQKVRHVVSASETSSLFLCNFIFLL